MYWIEAVIATTSEGIEPVAGRLLMNGINGYAVEDGYIAIHPHNIFLKMQTELGIIGSILFIAFIIATIITLYKLIKSTRNKLYSSITIGVLTSFITFIFMNLLDCYFNSPKVVATMFVILALVNSLRIKINSKIIN